MSALCRFLDGVGDGAAEARGLSDQDLRLRGHARAKQGRQENKSADAGDSRVH